MVAPSRSVSSYGTTQSAPVGRTAPVMTSMHESSATGMSCARIPAACTPSTRNRRVPAANARAGEIRSGLQRLIWSEGFEHSDYDCEQELEGYFHRSLEDFLAEDRLKDDFTTRDLDQQVAELEAQQQQLTDSEQKLRAKVEAFRTKKEVIKAQYNAAEAQVRISEAATVAIEAGKQASYADKMSMNYLIEGVVGDLPKS